MIKVNIDLKAINNLDTKINLFTHSAILKIVGQVIYSDIKDKFIDERDVKNNKFSPLKPSTIKQKQRQGKVPYKILRDTGQLLNSLNFTTQNGKISIGYSVPYAKFINNGTRKMVQRKILPDTDSEIPILEIGSLITDYFINI